VLHRPHRNGIVVITQPAHAWLSGQLARAWGNEQTGPFAPREDVCLAAEQHDLGWMKWEQAPTWNRRTGYPHTFLEVPLTRHLPMWSAAGPTALAFGRYVALLVSMHGSRLYARRDNPQDSPATLRGIQKYLQGAHQFERQMLALLRRDAYYQKFATRENVDRNQRLVAVWDYMSLLICMGVHKAQSVPNAPFGRGLTALELRPLNQEMTQIAVRPWPFKSPTLRVWCEGRILAQKASSQAAQDAKLKRAPWIRLEFELVKAER
jgi:hypothetical protein